MFNTDLYYNDYNEWVPEKQDKILKLLNGMRSRGIQVDGIGLQSHHNIYVPDIETVKRSMDRYANSGFKLKITELDVSMFRFEDESRIEHPTTEMYRKQAELYGELFKLYREYSEVIESVSLWGIADDYSWLDNFPVQGRKNWPLLFDEQGNEKEAFYRIMDF